MADTWSIVLPLIVPKLAAVIVLIAALLEDYYNG